jgi:Cof subfamily protein (haloacid dehalogenase superfamily)
MIKLLAVDVDGTLLDSRGKLPAENLDALNAAVSAGVKLAIVTGRSYSFALPAVAALPDPLLLIVHNGAIARDRGGRTMLRRLLARDSARAVLEATLDWRSATLLYFDRPSDRQIVTDRLDWTQGNRVGFHERNRDIIEQVLELEAALTEDPIQLAFNGSLRPMRDVVAALARHPAAADLAVSVTEYPHRDFSLVDVNSAGTTKGQTLARIAAELGIDRAEVMAIGDNANDRDMLEWAGVGIVMGNASEELRSMGLEITGTNDEFGLATAVRKYLHL